MNTPRVPELIPDIGVPFESRVPLGDLHSRAIAACETAKDLVSYGLNLITTEEEEALAMDLVKSYAVDPENDNKTLTTQQFVKQTPASLILARNILDEFGQVVVQNSLHLRHLVTNKLILESENPDARVRLRALELLGKISDVGLFTEKKEVTLVHSTTDDLRASLKSKLTRLVSDDEGASDAVYEVVD